MNARTAIVLSALAVTTVHFLDEIWLRDSSGTAFDAKAGATIIALSLPALVALAWTRLPQSRPFFAFAGLFVVSGAWSNLIGPDASGSDLTSLAYLGAANALLAVGIGELVRAVGTRLQTQPARA
jgi:hypothetical protein